ncbi:MarR family winged helix-turn-helix transcriptional regulator [Pararhizobium sp. IMCC21322]|uniref:MarR family winged helix-turn-helix transcriptional regulator n=1 Tax=Pararhizobium sp. IMCC21322 TaxID=3067903 RepID=UPI0027411643|nr:MarR family transcriptional regulator [Pararhizobium sp. IMCC21322]
MDEIDTIKAQWAQQRPDLDTDPMALIGRLMRLTQHLSQEMAETFARFDLTGASFDVLATLLRSGPPHALSPNQLLSTMMITSGTMTNRIDQLEKQQLVRRIKSMEDRRSVQIALTEKGRAVIDEAVTAHVATQTRLVSSLPDKEREDLDQLLRKYLAQISD